LYKKNNNYKLKSATFLEQCIEVNMNKVMIKMLQGSVVTQIVLDGPISSICKFRVGLVYMCKNYDSCLAVDKIIAVIKRAPSLFDS